MNQQKFVALHSTDSEKRSAFSCIKRGSQIQDILAFLEYSVQKLFPTMTYGDSQPCLDILEANTVTTRVNHIATPIHYCHEQIHLLDRFKPLNIDTHLNLTDSGTKPTPALIFRGQHDHMIGIHHYPKPGTEHYELLELHQFVTNPHTADQVT